MLVKGEFSADSIWTKPLDYVQSPFRYPGGKFYALKYIMPFINSYPHDYYIEPFIGGGSVFFGKKKAADNWINDLDNDLIETYNAIKSKKRVQILLNRVTSEAATKERHNEIVNYEPQSKNDIAYKTYYLNRMSYSGIIHKPSWGYAVGASSPPNNWGKFLLNANKKLKNTIISCMDFEEIFNNLPPKRKKVLLYLDPPYYLADQKRAYKKSFQYHDHERLAKRLPKLNHAFVLSYDDCKEVRKLYNWAYIHERSWFYNTGNSNGPRPLGKELIITNFKVDLIKQSL